MPSAALPDPQDGVYTVEVQASTPAGLPKCTSALSGTVAYVSSPADLWACSGGSWCEIKCSSTDVGDVAYASSTQTLVACVSNAWTPVALPKGAQGPQGPAGPQGPQGVAGATGPAGPTGAQGATGAQGPQGIAGATGAAGEQGLQGNSGPAGANGAQGPVGPQGPTGPLGPAGTNGTNGTNGSLVAASSEGPGAHCVLGGERIDIGVDTNGDGTLESSEIQQTVYLCNQASGVGVSDSGSGGGFEAGAGSDASGVEGGACATPTDCPPTGSACSSPTCVTGVCGVSFQSTGTVCSDRGGAACDGLGTCTQTFTVVRIGDGVAPLASSASPVFLETYYPLAGAAPIAILPLPMGLTGSNQPLLLGGTATTEGGLSRSQDGHYVTLAGYGTTPGSSVVASGITHVVGRVDAAGNVDTTTRLSSTAFSGANVRGATSADGQEFWISGTSASGNDGGVWYAPLGALDGGTQVLAAPDNMRWVSLFAGQLYGDSGASGFTSVFTVAPPEPTTSGATATPLAGMSTTNPLGFVLLDLDPAIPGPDVLYVADLNAGLQHWVFDGTTWTKDAAFNVLPSSCVGVTGWATGGGATLIVTTSTGGIERVDVPTVGEPVATLLVTAASNTAYRGVALAAH